MSPPPPTAPDAIRPPPRRRGLLRAILRVPALVAVAIYFLIDDVVLALVRPFLAWAAELAPFARLGAWIARLPPYPTLILFLVPFLILEPFKIGGLWLLATGHVTTGAIMLVSAHLLSIVLVERLFHLTRATLLRIGWFARGYGLVVALRDWSLGRLEATPAWRWAAARIADIRRKLRDLRRALAPRLARLRGGLFATVRRWRALKARR